MILGNNRAQVVENIKNAANQRRLNDKVEVDDPNLNKEQKRSIVKKFTLMHGKTAYNIKNKCAMIIVRGFTYFLNKETKIEGIEKLKEIDTGAIITNNHFNQIDSTITGKLVYKLKRKKYYIITEETNLAMPGFIGFIMNYANTIPITAGIGYLRHEFSDTIEQLLKKKRFILIYPEQEMWFNYKKPRPVKKGAYYYAAKNNVPIISCFTQMIETDQKDTDEFNKVKYILHILDPIYPDSNKSFKENVNSMMEKDYNQKVEAYEKAYGKKLSYDFDYSDIAGYVKHE